MASASHEEEVPLYDAAHDFTQAAGGGGDAGDDAEIDALAESIAGDLDRLNIGAPRPGAAPASIVIQFWNDSAAAPLAFLFEADEIYVPRATLETFFTQLRDAPWRARMTIDCDDDDDYDAEEAPAVDDAEEAPAVDDVEEAPAVDDTISVVVDDVPTNWAPVRGRVCVLLVVYAQAPVIIGLLTERYALGAGADEAGAPLDAAALGNLNANGKRIAWLDGAGGKRARTDAAGASAAGGGAEAPAMRTGMAGFAAGGAPCEWTSSANDDAVVCAFERDSVTGQVTEVRLALALHTLALRREIEGALQDTRNNV